MKAINSATPDGNRKAGKAAAVTEETKAAGKIKTGKASAKKAEAEK